MPSSQEAEFRFVVDSQTAVIFDLDDTLYKERQFQISGFRAVLQAAGFHEDEGLIQRMLEWSDADEDPLGRVRQLAGSRLSQGDLLEEYRSHDPAISLAPGALRLLTDIRSLGGRLGLLTDGRSKTQWNKIRALGIGPLFQAVVISEEVGSTKPTLFNYEVMSDRLGLPSRLIAIADNPRKDFVTPNQLGWTTIQLLDNGSNIHPQSVLCGEEFQAAHRIHSLEDLLPCRDSGTTADNTS